MVVLILCARETLGDVYIIQSVSSLYRRIGQPPGLESLGSFGDRKSTGKGKAMPLELCLFSYCPKQVLIVLGARRI